MIADLFLFVSENVALGLLSLAVVIVLVRLFRGPTLSDRILALDMLTMLAISLIGVLTLRTGVDLLLDIALALCLVGFVATVALARYALTRKSGQAAPAAPGGNG
jgi:multicomponent Na+:H+ antiporter subunit F